LQVSIVLGIAAVVCGLTAAIAACIFLASTDTAQQGAERLFGEVSARLEERVSGQIEDLLSLTGLTAALPVVAEPVNGPPLQHPAAAVLLRALAQNEAYFATQIGFADGSMVQAIAARGDPRLLGPRHAPPETWTMMRSIIAASGGQARREIWTFLDRAGAVLAGSDRQTPPSLDPRERPWYQQGLAAGKGPSLTDPYMYITLPEAGLTATAPGPQAGVVLGIDITLRRLGAFVAEQTISPHGGMVLLDRQRRVLALSPTLLPARGAPPLAPLAGLDQPLLAGLATLPADARVARISTADGAALASLTNWTDRNGRTLSLGIIAPFSDFTAPINDMQRRILLTSGLALLVMVPLSLLVARRVASVITALTEQARQVERLDFTRTPALDSPIREVDELSRAFGRMSAGLERHIRAEARTRARQHRLIELALALAAERDPSRLMEMVLAGARELADADGGTLYRRDGEVLRVEIMRNDSLGIRVGGPGEAVPTLAPVPLTLPDGHPNHTNLASHAVLGRRTVAIDDIEADSRRFDLSATRLFDQRTGYRSRSLLTVPLLSPDGEAIGALSLVNARDEGLVIGFEPEVQRAVEVLAAQAATALGNQQRLDAQDRLIEAMARTLARAIDGRGGDDHCTRVPELAMMLTEAAARTDQGPLASFSLSTEQWREFRIGAWLHDCGKVTTPDFLLDKATRLETVHNRIHEIRTRFEVLWRDARITRLEAEAAGTPPEQAEAAFAAATAQLREEFAFVAASNLGETEMTPQRIERLRAIATRTWMRHFDDRLGLSARELRRLTALPPPVLPTPEPLLADRPQQVVPRRANDLVLQGETERPAHLYDFGELHCLSVQRGTLTLEERAKVNEHASQTVALLESLPFPPSLARVPEQAGSHHETLTGSGYPRHLTAEDLSVPARVLAIADRFETLTSTPGPDGRPPRLSQAVRTLAAAKTRGEIDPDLFDLLLTSGLYRRYAERFLAEEQIDPVEIASHLARSPT